jgi:hypothetical protein
MPPHAGAARPGPRAVAVWGAAFAGFAVAPGLGLTLGLLAVTGAVDTITVVFRQSILQAVTPDRLRGRLLAADYVVAAGAPSSATWRPARSRRSPPRSSARWPAA